jgi:hypothetical protein
MFKAAVQQVDIQWALAAAGCRLVLGGGGGGGYPVW